MPLKHTRQDALEYHRVGRPGKIEVRPTKPCLTQLDLSLAYSPGVAEPCREIAKDPEKVYEYTAKGNLVAVVTDGSAVLGLGDIGPLAGKPVMEGKGVLFKRFADIDVFDIELGTKDVEEIIIAVKAIAPTVAGINLEDISAPRCFEIERRLREELDIPVFHDDQPGPAVISGAGLSKALAVAGKKIEEIRLVVNGAGASAIACTNFAIGLGLKRENLILCDTKGVVWKGRPEGMNEYKAQLAADTPHRTLAEAIRDADVFLGLSGPDVLTPEMLLSMAKDPIVFALANPDPEIRPELAKATRDDVIIATGRSDYPNQVNNVLGFPFIFRGALDVRARTINREMLYAATHALAELAREPVPENVAAAYGLKSEDLAFGRESLIPKPLDHRVIRRVATAVARAAMETGVARKIVDLEEYVRTLGERIGEERDLMRMAVSHARRNPRRIVYPEGDAERILIAAEAVVNERIAQPVLVGDEALIRARADEFGVSLNGVEIADPARSPKLAQYANELHELRRHRRVDAETAHRLMLDPLWFGPMMLRMGDADGLVCGVRRQVRKTMAPMLKTIPLRPDARLACGLTMVFTSHGTVFLADTSVNINPTDEQLAEIALLSAEQVREFGIEPIVAMISFSSFGGTPHPQSDLVRRAVRIAREEAPHLVVDGEMRVDCALDPTVQQRYPDCILAGRRANVLVFPNLESANIGFNLVRLLADLPVVGPLMLGLSKPAHMLQPHSCGVRDVVHLTAIACMQAQGGGAAPAAVLRAALGNGATREKSAGA